MNADAPEQAILNETTASSEAPLALQDIPWSEAARIVASGVCMGTADVVPGVSGGTMAVALGIYRQLLAAIASIDAQAIRSLLKFDFASLLKQVHWRFLGSLLGGALLALVVMLKVVKLPQLLESNPEPVYAVFFGLVLASALLLARKLPKWTGLDALLLVLGTALGWMIVTLVPVDTPETWWFIMLSGMIAICAMILPGISGSFILLILGKYAYVIGAVEHLQLSIVLPFMAGCLIGITSFSRFLGWLLDRYHNPVVASLIGLLLGSLWRIWPYQHLQTVVVREKVRVIGAIPYLPESWDLKMPALVLLGILTVFLVEYLAGRNKRSEA